MGFELSGVIDTESFDDWCEDVGAEAKDLGRRLPLEIVFNAFSEEVATDARVWVTIFIFATFPRAIFTAFETGEVGGAVNDLFGAGGKLQHGGNVSWGHGGFDLAHFLFEGGKALWGWVAVFVVLYEGVANAGGHVVEISAFNFVDWRTFNELGEGELGLAGAGNKVAVFVIFIIDTSNVFVHAENVVLAFPF